MVILSCGAERAGAVTAAGVGCDELVETLLAGRSCDAPVTLFDVEDCSCERACEAPDFDLAALGLSPKGYLDRSTELALAAASFALRTEEQEWGNRKTDAGLSLGTAWGNLGSAATFWDQLQAKGARFVSPILFQHVYPNTTASVLAIEFGLAGVHTCFNSGSAASAQALFHAVQTTARGAAETVLAGGVDALDELVLRKFDAEHRLPQKGVPDAEHSFLGEGAGFVSVKRHVDSCPVRLTAAWGHDPKEGVKTFLASENIKPSDLGAIIVSDSVLDGSASRQPWWRMFELEGVQVIFLRDIIGETFGASAAIASAAAWELAERARNTKQESWHALVVQTTRSKGTFSFLFSPK